MFVFLRKRLYAVLNRLEKVETSMQWLEKSSVFTQVQGLWSFKSTLTRLHATHHSHSLPSQIEPRALGVVLSRSTSKSRRGRCSNSGDLDQKTTIAHHTSWCLFFHDVWINFLRVSSLGWSRAQRLFKGVGREIAVIEGADKVFSKVQHSRNPVADDTLQVTSQFPGPKAHSASRKFSWRLRLCSQEVNATLLQLCGSRWRMLRSSHDHEFEVSLRDLLASVVRYRVQARGLNLQVLLSKVCTLGSKSSSKRQTQGRLEGDRYVEGEVL